MVRAGLALLVVATLVSVARVAPARANLPLTGALNAATIALAPTPPMGWNPWYEFGCQDNETIVEQTAQAMISSGMAAAGYRYVNLDDCWMAPQRDPGGELQPDPQTFPEGIAALASFVHGLGLRLGIYLDAGSQTCMERPGSSAYLAQDAATLASWDVDFIKVDYCYTGFTPPAPLYEAVERAMAATGRPMVLSIADDGFKAPWQWAPGIASLWRTTNDYTAYGAAQGNWWAAVLKIVDLNSRLYPYAQPGAWNDPDVLLTGTSLLTIPQERAQFSLWSMMAAPLLVGGDLRSMSPATAAIVLNRDVIAVDQDPAGHQGRRIVDRGGHQIWIKALADGSHAVLFFNTDRRAATMTLPASRAGIRGGHYAVRDLWQHRSWTSATAKLRARVASDDVVMLRIGRIPQRQPRGRSRSHAGS